MSRSIFPVLAAMALLGSPPMAARAAQPPTADMTSSEPLIARTTTEHRLTLGRNHVLYEATFEETPLSDADGKPQATISSTSYTRRRIKDLSKRPVVFLFNGGPGASSSPLHFGAFGPKRFERDSSGSRKLVDNSASLLDEADLVFVDPVGTGFSRERPGVNSGTYWGPQEDASTVLTLIRLWLQDHHRESSPLFIAGESYGGFRLAIMMQHAEDLQIAGLILISPMLDASGSSTAAGNDLPYIFDLPAMAVAAWEHHRVDRGNSTIEQVYEQVQRFAQTDYAVALQQGSAIAPAERDRLAAQMSGLIGLPAAVIAADNLRVDSQAFLEQLLGAEGLIVGRLDTRVTAPKPVRSVNPDRPAAANDPALGLGASNIIKSDAIKAYMQHELNVQTARDYISVTLDVNFRWNWREQASGDDKTAIFYVNPTPNIAAIMKKQPSMRLLLLGGYYDMAVPLPAPRYALQHAGVPLDRVSMEAFAAGHSPFDGDANLRRASEVVHRFLRGEK